MQRRVLTVAVVAALTVTGLAGPVATAGAQTTQQAPVESCTVIAQSGSYELGTDLANVTAEDLRNVSADGANGTAANATGANVTEANAAANNVTETETTDRQNATATGRNATARDAAFTVGNESARACITITADDVVFEGSGHAVTGPLGPNASAGNVTDDGATSVGIAVVPATENGTVENVTLRNVSVSGFDVGVYVQNAENVTFGNLTARGNAESAISVVGETGENASAMDDAPSVPDTAAEEAA